jgi:hypothetical protein
MDFTYVAEDDDSVGVQPAALIYKQKLGQYESSQPILPEKLKIRPAAGP